MKPEPPRPGLALPNAAVIVAHPDDETLWAGGAILSRSTFRWFIAGLCRQSDPDRSPRFHQALEAFAAEGALADLEDGADQKPLPAEQVQHAILSMLPMLVYDLVVTHAPQGEYTRHRRHEEVSQAVIHLWQTGRIVTNQLWLFAYEDGNGQYLPRAIQDAHHVEQLTPQTVDAKYRLITEIYGFRPDSWEARVTPASEAFWRFDTPDDYERWMRARRPL